MSKTTGEVSNEAAAEECAWVQDDNEYSTTLETSCGAEFWFEDGTPSDNRMKFCCYCGKRLVEKLMELPDDGVCGPDAQEGTAVR